jgi:hypothetical protein
VRRARWLALPLLAALAHAGAEACDGGGGQPDAGPDAEAGVTTRSFDVVVVGATAGGIAAAIEAARVGAQVALLEETDVIGGQFATQAVGPADDPGFNNESGIYAELRARAAAYYAGAGKTFIRAVEPHVAVQIFGDMLAAAGVTVFLRARVVSVDATGNVVSGVRAATHDAGDVDFAAKVVIDATDTGDVIALSPARYRAGNRTSDALDPSACVQDITYGVVIEHYPNGAPSELLVSTKPPGYDPAPFDAFFQKTGWTFDQFVRYRALPNSSSATDWDGGADLSAITKTVVNAYNDFPMRVADLERSARASAYCQAKLRTLQALYYIEVETGHSDWAIATDEGYDTPYNLEEAQCAEVPAEYKGVEKYFPPTPYVREGRRLVGVTTLVASQAARVGTYPNAYAAFDLHGSAAVNDYAFDLHGCSDEASLEPSLETLTDVPDASPGVYAPGVYGPFQVPLEALVPETVDGLLAAEKNISVSRLVNGATRVHPDVMHNGMAAGALAAIAVARGVRPRDVPPVVVQDRLARDTSALALHPFDDVGRDAGTSWGDVQIASTWEILDGLDAGYYGASAALTRGESAGVVQKLFSLPAYTGPQAFADVPASRADYGAVQSIFGAGLTSGCGGGNFCPDQPLERGQMAIFVVKALGLDPLTAPQVPLYDDVTTDGGVAAEFPFVQLFGQAGLLDPCGPKLFCPVAAITRAEAAQVVRRTLVRLAK